MTYIVKLKDRFRNYSNKTITLSKEEIDLLPYVSKNGNHNSAIDHKVHNDYPDTTICKITRV